MEAVYILHMGQGGIIILPNSTSKLRCITCREEKAYLSFFKAHMKCSK
jgi:hypothetical protein